MKKNSLLSIEIDNIIDQHITQFEKTSSKTDLKVVKNDEQKLTSIFYKLANHDEIHRFGREFMTDFKNGKNHFAFSSVNGREGQRKTLLGVACYFHHVQNLKIAVFSENLNEGIFNTILTERKYASMTGFVSPCGSISVFKFPDNFDFVSIDPRKKLSTSLIDNHEYMKMVNDIIAQYNLVFWDVPTMEEIKQNIQLYYPLILSTNSLTWVLGEEQVKSGDLTDFMKFFDNYGVSTKGVVIDKKPVEGKIAKKLHKIGWLKRLFTEFEEE